MKNVVSISIAVAFIMSLIPIIIAFLKNGSGNNKILNSVIATFILFNAIWYSVLIVEFVQSSLPFNSKSELVIDVVSVTFMFLVRFLFLFPFLKLLQVLLDFKLKKDLVILLKVLGITLVTIWLLGLLEFFVLESRVITRNLLLYTDILIFFVVIVFCIYLFYQVNSFYETKNRKAIKLLSIIFLTPMILGFLKWLAGDMFVDNLICQQLSIPFIVFIFSFMLSAWFIIYGKKLNEFSIIRKTTNNANEIIKDYKISKREIEIISLISEGATNKEIAEKLFISIDTVKDHNSRIFQKTGVKNRTQLAKMFLK